MAAPDFRFCDNASKARLHTLRDRIAPILANRVHRHFTDHSVDHSDRVVALSDALASALPEDKRLSNDEAFVLYGACYTHDVGMHNERAGMHGRLAQALAQSKTSWSDLSEQRRLDLLREHHHEVSADMIVASRRLDGTGYTSPPTGLALDDADFPGEIAAVAESHVVDTESSRFADLVGQLAGSHRLRLLSALLRVADILDEAQHRALRSKAETLDLNDESQMHWWRHYYTREVIVDLATSLITVIFEFPHDQEREYESVVPELQMPWVRCEFERHRGVFAANRLTWAVASTVRRSAFSTLDPMSPSVMIRMLRAVAQQKSVGASVSRKTLLEYEDRARTFSNTQISTLTATRAERNADEYLRDMERAAADLHAAGGTLSAIAHLRSAIHYATTDGRTVDGRTHVSAPAALGRLLFERGDNRDAVLALRGDAEKAAAALPDSNGTKAQFYRWLAKVSIVAGDFSGGREAAKKAMRLLLAGPDRDELQAELHEAIMLEGLDPEGAPNA
jgi:hypothetical protein